MKSIDPMLYFFKLMLNINMRVWHRSSRQSRIWRSRQKWENTSAARVSTSTITITLEFLCVWGYYVWAAIEFSLIDKIFDSSHTKMVRIDEREWMGPSASTFITLTYHNGDWILMKNNPLRRISDPHLSRESYGVVGAVQFYHDSLNYYVSIW